MKTTLLLPFAAAAALLLGACESASQTSLPRVNYPVTYQVHVGNSQVASNYGPQTMSTNANQDVVVQPGSTLYFQAISPVPVNAYLYEKPDPTDSTTWRVVQKLQGTVISSSFVPSVSNVQFAFGVVSTNTSGTLQFTLSDQPLPQPQVQYVTPQVQYVNPPVQYVSPAPVPVVSQPTTQVIQQ